MYGAKIPALREIELIFQPFYRLAHHNWDYRGIGLGLALVKIGARF
jgi:signal transduction histidine kinase